MAKHRRRFQKNKRPSQTHIPKRSFRTGKRRSVRLRTPEQIARDATRPVQINIPGYRYINGRYVSSAESLLHNALNPPPLRFPGSPIQFRKQEPGW